MADRSKIARAAKIALDRVDRHFARAEAKRGLEKHFVDEFDRALRACLPNAAVTRERSWNEFKEPNTHYSRYQRERLDILVSEGNKHTGIEVKVCQSPRLSSTSDLGSMYDLGGISWDVVRLRESTLDNAAIVVVLHGVNLQLSASKTTLSRLFHDSLFVDYAKSLRGGEFADLENKLRTRQLKVIEQFGLDRPFDTKSSYFTRRHLAVSDSGNVAAFVIKV